MQSRTMYVQTDRSRFADTMSVDAEVDDFERPLGPGGSVFFTFGLVPVPRPRAPD